eukprot:g63114.t1
MGVRGRKKIPVICLETGESFSSLLDAGSFAKVHNGTISVALRTGGSAGGYHWIRKDDAHLYLGPFDPFPSSG